MTISERILLSISRAPGDSDYELQKEAITIDCALAILHRVYPNLSALVSGKRVMDFGCGAGYQCIALVKTYNCS
ncbi:MAG: hypothetical protein ONB11_05560, partial [candidate division KSB1 bacterium]|nr:hypothetical protein [candidate division KSB1 bacterium]